MDPKLACAAFRPPPPMSLGAYFDQVTSGRARTAESVLSVFSLDVVLRSIEARPTAAERYALLSVLEDRFVAYATPRGWLKPRTPVDPAGADATTDFIVKDLLGIEGKSVQDKTLSIFKGQIKKLIESGLNDKGKHSLKVLEFLWELCNAKDADEVKRILAKAPLTELSAWAAKQENITWLAKSALKLGRVSPVARNRIAKMIAARLTWIEVGMSRLAWVQPWLAALDLLLTPERIADDETERRLSFLTVYGRVFSQTSSQFGRLVKDCSSDKPWTLTIPPEQALGNAIKLSAP